VVAVDGVGTTADRAAGREAATEALHRVGGAVAPGAAGHHDDGRRRWPAGYTGSIAHAHGWAAAVAAVVGPDRRLGLGIDLERAGALTAADAAVVLTPGEAAAAASAADPDDTATRLWCCKEAAFKAWSNAAGGLGGVEPDQVVVALSDGPDRGEWTAAATGALRAQVTWSPTLSGVWCRVGSLVLATCSVSR
jgi:4'-phosphopantetheinyl transferase EntD